MEAKSNLKEGKAAQKDSFVTSSYLKQLEIQKESQLVIAVEEARNKRMTANADRGMSGFAKYIGKLKGIQQSEGPELDEPCSEQEIGTKDRPKDFRTRMEDKLKEIKQKQAERAEE